MKCLTIKVEELNRRELCADSQLIHLVLCYVRECQLLTEAVSGCLMLRIQIEFRKEEKQILQERRMLYMSTYVS